MWYWILAWLLTIVTVFGNGFVIYLIIRIQRLRTTTNWSVLSLAVADLLVGLTFYPLLFALNIHSLNELPEQTRTFFLVSRTFLYLSATNLFVMIMDRYIAIVHPLKYLSFVTTKLLVAALVTAWILPVLLFALPYPLVWGGKFLLLLRVSILQVLPVVFFIYVTLHIFFIMRRISKRQSKIFAQLAFNHAPKSDDQTRIYCSHTTESRAASKMTVAIMFFFIICYVLENCKCFCTVFAMCDISTAFEQAVDLLFVINSAVNPVAYAFLKRDVKSALRGMLVPLKKQAHSVQGTQMSSSEERTKDSRI